MKTPNVIAIALLIAAASASIHARLQPNTSAPQSIFEQLKTNDSLFYEAIFHTHDVKFVEEMLDTGFVFYQDQGYASPTTSQSRAKYLEGVQIQNPPMRREVVKGSLQVFLSGAREAIQMGVQHFYVLAPNAPDQLVEESKFSRVWRQINGHWQIASELDYQYNTHLNEAGTAPGPSPLSLQIERMDSLLFVAFNTRDMVATQNIYARDAIFFDDESGVTDYKQTMASFHDLFARHSDDGLQRRLLPGSLRVYPIKDLGALELGEHRFCHTENGQQDCGNFKFAVIWKNTPGGWQVLRAFSYGHRTPLGRSDALYQKVIGLDSDAFSASLDTNLESYHAVRDLNGNFGPETPEVYPIKDFGALEIGKRLNIWQLKNDKWSRALTISYGH